MKTILDGKCCEPNCAIDDTHNKGDKQIITCAAPYCESQFHLHCVGLKGKKISSLYFLCNACNEFINLSQNSLQERIKQLENQFKEFTCSMNNKISTLEKQLEEKTKMTDESSEKIEASNNENSTKICNFNDNLNKLDEKVNTQLNEIVNKINKLENESKIEAEVSKATNAPPLKQLPKETRTHANLKFQLKVSGIPEISEDINYIKRQQIEKEHIDKILKHIGKQQCKIIDCFRLGKYRKERQRSRSIIITFASVWDRNMVLQSAKNLSTFEEKIFISPALSPVEMEKEKKMLKKRWELINSGVDRKNIKIKNLSLFVDDKEVEME